MEGQTNENECTDLPNPVRGEVLKARNAMRVQAETSDDTSTNIIGGNVQQLSQAARVELPRIETMRRGIRRTRAGDNPVAPPPADRNFAIPPEFMTMQNGDQFLQYDSNNSNNNNERILIFGTVESLDFLGNANNWYMDGTFSVAPPQFDHGNCA